MSCNLLLDMKAAFCVFFLATFLLLADSPLSKRPIFFLSKCGALGICNVDLLKTTPRPQIDCTTKALQKRPSGRAVIIDAFMLAYEPPMLLLLRILETIEVVDAIVILERDSFHSGSPQNLTYPYLEQYLSPWNEKIFFRVLYYEDIPTDIRYDTTTHRPMLIERFQRDALAAETASVLHTLRSQGEKSTTVYVGISDADEIPRPEMIETIANCEGYIEPISLRPDTFMYSFRWSVDRKGIPVRGLGPVFLRFDERGGKVFSWQGGEIMAPGEGRWAGSSPSVARGLPQEEKLMHGSWHLNYFLSAEAIRLKLATFSHSPDFKTRQYSNTSFFATAAKLGHDFINRRQLESFNCLQAEADIPTAVKLNAEMLAFFCPS